MNTKDIKKYNLIGQIINTKPDDKSITLLFSELINIDFNTAFEVWEYILHTHQSRLGEGEVATILESILFELFNVNSETKTKALLLESSTLIRLIYTSATAVSGANLEFLVNLILSPKVNLAEEFLRAIKANNSPNLDYGNVMRILIDSIFTTYCQREGVMKCSLNKKQSTLLLDYISKIKGPNKLLLTQRIKEL